MTHPNREELAGRLEEGARAIEIDGTPSQVGPTPSDLRHAAAALRQSPSVEEVARIICGADMCLSTDNPGVDAFWRDHEPTAQAIDRLYGREG